MTKELAASSNPLVSEPFRDHLADSLKLVGMFEDGRIGYDTCRKGLHILIDNMSGADFEVFASALGTGLLKTFE